MQCLTMRDFIDTTGQVVCVFLLVSVLICKYVSFITCAFIYPCLLSYVYCDDILYTWQVRNDFNKDVYIYLNLVIIYLQGDIKYYLVKTTFHLMTTYLI